VVKRKDLLDGNLTTSRLMERGGDRSIGTLSNSMQKLIVFA
jgi:hypothetical protein